MIRAFLSHSSKDKDIVRKIKNKLTRIWTYFDEDCFQTGEDFRDAIVSRLESTSLFVFFASQNSLSSDWVKYELDEVYWQKIKRNNVEVIVLTLENIDIDKFPQWMRKAKIENVVSTNLAAQIITKELFKFVDSGKIYIGRENDFSKFNRALIDHYDDFPNIIAISGLEGIGRRTFINNFLKKRFNLNYNFEFKLNNYEGLNELYRNLINENIEHFSKYEMEESIKEFANININEKCKEIARLLSKFTENNSYPIIVDNGALLDNNGYYLPEILNTLKIFAEKYRDHYLVIIHKRIPQLNYCDKNLIYINKLNELSEGDSFSALDTLLKKNDIKNISKDKIKELAKYVDGYPPAIYYAVNECILYGIDAVCSDKTKLVDFKSGIFSGYIESLDLNNIDSNIIRLLYNLGELDIAIICILLEITAEDVAKSLTKCINYCIVSLNYNGYYCIAAPIRVAINHKYSIYSKKDMQKFSHKLIDEFNKNSMDKSLEFINVIITALLYAEDDNELNQFKTFLLPSTLVNIAHDFNLQREWKKAEKYIRKAIELDPNMLDAKILLFKLLVRQENSYNVSEIEKEEGSILLLLEEKHDKRKYYLCGFRYWKRSNFTKAIEQFELGKKAGDDSIQLHRDLAECYFQKNKINEAKKEIALVMKPERKIVNAFILDLAAKIAIYSNDFDDARSYIAKLEVLDKPANVFHRKATLAIKERKYNEALLFANSACNENDVLPQMIMLHMNIAIHSNKFDLVESDYQLLHNKFKITNNIIVESLYVNMLLKRNGWKEAEASFCKISNKDNSIAQNLYYKILKKKSTDESIPFGTRKKIETELNNIDISRTKDVLEVTQLYEQRNNNDEFFSNII